MNKSLSLYYKVDWDQYPKIIQPDHFADFIVVHIRHMNSASVCSCFLFVIENVNTVHFLKSIYSSASVETRE